MSRSLLRPPQLDSNGDYSFAQLTIDGYSGGDLQDGYLTGLIFVDRETTGTDTLRIHSDDGEINQIGAGQVTFTGNVHAKADVTIDGDLLVQGTTTTIDTDQMIVQDPITVVNADGTEALSDWAGFSMRDADGYNRTGWVFAGGVEDGYWGLSTDFSPVAQPDAVPDRAIAYVAAGDAYGDLSSTIDGDSGANKVSITEIPGLSGATDVQEALEALVAGGDVSGTDNDSWTVNQDATAGVDEDPCLILAGGDGTSLLEGYLCLITDSIAGDRWEFVIYEDGTHVDRDLHLGPLGDTSDVDACVTLNSGDGTSAVTASLCLDGSQNRVEFTGPSFFFDGYVSLDDNLTVAGRIDAYGDVVLGDGLEDCIIFNGVICSDIIPCCDDAYDIGSPTNRWQDGYFVNLNIDGITIEDITINGDTILGDDAYDCVIFNASVCSDIIPCCDDSYQLGDTTHTWIDAYFNMPTFTNITPVGDDNSLIGVLEGIDNALADATVDHPRGVYVITLAEGTADELDSTRTPDQGDTADTGAGDVTDAVFQDNFFVYWNGQLLYNDPSPATTSGSSGDVVNDVARKSGDLSTLLFGSNLRKGAVIQIVDMR